MRQGGWRWKGIVFTIAVLGQTSAAGPGDLGSTRRPADFIGPQTQLSTTTGAGMKDDGAASASGVIYLDPELRLGHRHGIPAQSGNPVFLMLKDGLEKYRVKWGGLPQVTIPWGEEVDTEDSGPVVDALFIRLGIARSTNGRLNRELSGKLQAFQSAHGLRATGKPDAATITALNRGPTYYEAIIRSDLEQARGIAVDPDAKFVFVNTAAASLTAYEGGRINLEMNVVVGSVDRPTHALADRIDTIVVNPRWNVPPHLVRSSIAPAVARKGEDHLQTHGFEVLTDWSHDAEPADPSSVNWRAVAQGEAFARVRQKPGAANPMGRVKFMFPNPLGIYLHDTPDPISSSRSNRYVSNGCVRLERPGELAQFLAGNAFGEGEVGGMTRRIDLARPVPILIMHLRFAVRDGKPRFYPDVYG